MTPKRRLNFLLTDDSSQHARAAVEWYPAISLPPKSRILIVRLLNSEQISLIRKCLSNFPKVRSRS